MTSKFILLRLFIDYCQGKDIQTKINQIKTNPTFEIHTEEDEFEDSRYMRFYYDDIFIMFRYSFELKELSLYKKRIKPISKNSFDITQTYDDTELLLILSKNFTDEKLLEEPKI